MTTASIDCPAPEAVPAHVELRMGEAALRFAAPRWLTAAQAMRIAQDVIEDEEALPTGRSIPAAIDAAFQEVRPGHRRC